MCVVRAVGTWLGACSQAGVEETRLATRDGWRSGCPALPWCARCQRGPCVTGWPERRILINIVHYPGEQLVFFIALSSGCNLLVLQFQWLKRQFRSSQFIVKGFPPPLFLCVFLARFLFRRKTADRMHSAKQS